MREMLVVSPGVLPLPPVLGGAVENLIYRLHPYLKNTYSLHYISIAAPAGAAGRPYSMEGAHFHYVRSIDPLEDFSLANDFELSESEKWPQYRDFCVDVARSHRFALVHIHNEASLVVPLRKAAADARIVLHINDEFLSRMGPDELDGLARGADLIVSCSRFIDDAIGRSFREAGVASPRRCVLHNFIDTRVFDPLALERSRLDQLAASLGLTGSRVVLFVGRLVEPKGPHLALRAARLARAVVPDLKLLFVGAPWYSRNNRSRFVDELRAEARGRGDSVVFTGYVDQQQLPYYYGLADVLVVPSIWDDPSPLVAYEGQAMGVPVIGSGRGGIPEIVEHGQTGFCIDAFNTPLFARKLELLCSDPESRAVFGRRGRERVLARFDVRTAAARLLGHYADLLG